MSDFDSDVTAGETTAQTDFNTRAAWMNAIGELESARVLLERTRFDLIAIQDIASQSHSLLVEIAALVGLGADVAPTTLLAKLRSQLPAVPFDAETPQRTAVYELRAALDFELGDETSPED